MIIWATEFPVPHGTTPDAILALCRKWLNGSPHLPFAGTTFPNVVDGDSLNINQDGHSVRFARVTLDGSWWTGCQHVWTEDGRREWTTQVVANGSATSVTVGVRLECNLLAAGLPLPRPKKPYIMKMFLTMLGGGSDSWLTVDDEPTFLGEAQVDEAAAIIQGRTPVALPVVYVSALSNHRPYIDPTELAEWLAGMAHVVVEPSRHFSFALARNVARKNPYGGAIAVFWPRAVERQSRLMPRDFDSGDAMAVECASRVRIALSSIRPTPTLTWSYLQELIARQRLDALRRAGSTELEEFATAFDAELASKDERLQDAEREIGRLHAEIRRLEAAGGDARDFLARGNEPEYYAGEIQDAVLFALGLATSSLEQNGRRWHLVQDLLASVQPSGTADAMAEDIKRCFASSGDLTAAARRTLEDLDFEISDDRRHYKAMWQGDGRYTFTISKTSSDHRAGRNLASLINRTLFK
jgi:hypothetical protein